MHHPRTGGGNSGVPSPSAQSSASLDDTSSDAASPRAATAAPSSLSYTVELFENERWFPMSGWCPKRLPSDRPHFSSKDGKTELDPLNWSIPSGYEWIGDWGVDKEHPKGNDVDGWRYGFAWGTHFHPTVSSSTFVRRRRWIRTMIRLPVTTTIAKTLANGDEHVREEKWDSHTKPRGATLEDPSTKAPSSDLPTSTVPIAHSKRAPARTHTKEAPLSAAAGSHEDAAAAAQDEIYQDDLDNAPADESNLAPSESMRYFVERQATSSVIGRGRATAPAPANNEGDDMKDVAAAAPTSSAAGAPHLNPSPAADTKAHRGDVGGEESPVAPPAVSVPPPKNLFAPDDDEDAAFYGFAAHHTPKVPEGPESVGPAAIQIVPATVAAGRGATTEEAHGHNDDLSFQKTLTEIVEDVDRSDAQDQQVWGSFSGGSPYGASSGTQAIAFGGGGTGEEPAAAHNDEDAFANMLMHFVAKAKDE